MQYITCINILLTIINKSILFIVIHNKYKYILKYKT